jgi:hypothetical protein
MAPSCKEFEAKLLASLDFSCIHGYPHELHYQLWKQHSPRFYGNQDLASEFATSFIRFIVEFNIINEDVMLKMLSLSMQEHEREWFCNLSPREYLHFHISS